MAFDVEREGGAEGPAAVFFLNDRSATGRTSVAVRRRREDTLGKICAYEGAESGLLPML